MNFEERVMELMATHDEIYADLVTDDGRITFDADHSPNGKQNTIGARLGAIARKGWFTNPEGRTRISTSPYRRGGRQQVWTVTPKGRYVAEVFMRRRP